MAELLRPNQAGSTQGRRRIGARHTTGSTPGRLKTVLTSGSKHEGSDAQEIRPLHHFKMENSYRMRPQTTETFQSSKVQKMMEEVLRERLEGMTYDSAACQALAKDLSTEIQKRVKDFRWQRYRFVCQVTVGQQSQQGLHVASRCVWDHKVDSHASVTYSTKSLFAVAQCYGVYFE